MHLYFFLNFRVFEIKSNHPPPRKAGFYLRQSRSRNRSRKSVNDLVKIENHQRSSKPWQKNRKVRKKLHNTRNVKRFPASE